MVKMGVDFGGFRNDILIMCCRGNLSVMAVFLSPGIDEPSQFFFAYTEQPTDTVSSQFAASDQATNRLVADIQPASDGWDVEQLPARSLITRAIRYWRRCGHYNTSGWIERETNGADLRRLSGRKKRSPAPKPPERSRSGVPPFVSSSRELALRRFR
jgi:hypothetical protein